jgi:hypothetical protein
MLQNYTLHVPTEVPQTGIISYLKISSEACLSEALLGVEGGASLLAGPLSGLWGFNTPYRLFVTVDGTICNTGDTDDTVRSRETRRGIC